MSEKQKTILGISLLVVIFSLAFFLRNKNKEERALETVTTVGLVVDTLLLKDGGQIHYFYKTSMGIFSSTQTILAGKYSTSYFKVKYYRLNPEHSEIFMDSAVETSIGLRYITYDEIKSSH